jgi:hypothetical protein
MKHSFIHNKKGNTTLIMVHVVAIILLLGFWGIDAGRIFYTHIAYIGYARAAGADGMVVVGDEMKSFVEAKRDEIESEGGTFIPKPNLWENMTEEELKYLWSPQVRSQVLSRVKTMLDMNIYADQGLAIPPYRNLEIIYPVDEYTEELAVLIRFEVPVRALVFLKKDVEYVRIVQKSTLQIR